MRARVLFTVLCTTALATAWPASAASPPVAGSISTIAGTGQNTGAAGDGGPATSAVLDTPSGIALDAAGNTYVSEYWSSRVRKITPQGVITTFAGTGTFGSGADGGQAAATPLKTPTGLVADRQGNVYIADDLDSRVRKVSPSGVITTVAGNGSYAFSGDGGPATAAGLDKPTGLAVDAAGNLFIADTDNNRIRKVDTNGTISTVMGTGGAGSTANQLNHPRGVAVDSTGIFVADTDNDRIQKLIFSIGFSATVAGGPGNPLRLSKPYGVALDPAGNAYIADTGNNRIEGLSSAGKIRTIAGTAVAGFSGDGGQAAAARLNAPQAIALDPASTLSIVDTGNGRVRRMVALPLMTSVIGTGVWGNSGDGGPAANAMVEAPYGTVFDQSGNLYVGDPGAQNIRKISPSGTVTTFVSYSGTSIAPNGLAIDRPGNIYFADQNTNTVRKVDPQGATTVLAGIPGQYGSSGDDGPATDALLGKQVTHVAVDAAGDIFIADNGNYKIRKVDPGGVISTFAGTGTAGFSGDGGPAIAAQLDTYLASTVATDAAGDVYLSDTDNHRIRKIGANGIITTVVGTGAPFDQSKTPFYYYEGAAAGSVDLYQPGALTVDSTGAVYYQDFDTIDKVGADGIIHVIAGTGYHAGENSPPPSGSGGAAKLAEFGSILSIAVDSGGNTYAADESGRRVYRIAAG